MDSCFPECKCEEHATAVVWSAEMMTTRSGWNGYFSDWELIFNLDFSKCAFSKLIRCFGTYFSINQF